MLDRDGSLLASTVREPGRAERFVAGVQRLLDEADRVAAIRGLPELTQLETSTRDGSVFVVRRGGRLIAAATRPDPTVGLVLYDLKHCLGSLDASAAGPEANGKPARGGAGSTGATRTRTPRKKADTSA